MAEQVALWVAGAPVELPRIRPHDVPAVLDLLDGHCLLGRAMSRGLAERVDAELGGLIAARQTAVEALVKEQRASVQEIVTAVGPGSVAVLKGMATYGLTDQREALRTGDVDVVVSADVDIAALLGDLGYRQTRGPFMHERGEYTRALVEIDVHEHYPVVGRPLGTAVGTLGGRFASALGDTGRGTLSGEMLLRTARPTTAPLLDGLPVVAPEAQVVILAVHSFMNYVNAWSISHRDKVWVRLAELLDVELLTGRADFPHDDLARLVTAVGAQDAIAFVRHVGRILLGREILHGSWPDHHALPPRAIWWDTWIETPPPTSFLIRTNWFDVDGLVANMGTTHIRPEVVVEVEPTMSSQGVLSTSESAPALWCRMTLSPWPELEVGVAGVSPDEPLRLRIDGGSWAVEWSRVPDQALGAFSGNVEGRVSDHVGRVALRAYIPDSKRNTALLGAALVGQGRTTEASMVAVEWDPLG